MERTRNWKVLSWKVRSWKEPSEVEKNRLKLERIERGWKEPNENGKLESFAAVGKFWLKLESLNELGKLSLELESVTAESGPKWTVQKKESRRSLLKVIGHAKVDCHMSQGSGR